MQKGIPTGFLFNHYKLQFIELLHAPK